MELNDSFIPNTFTPILSTQNGWTTDFHVHDKLEARNIKVPNTIGVATIKDIKDDKLLIHFDSFSSFFDYWIEKNLLTYYWFLNFFLKFYN
jgi:hypothetical protein